VAQKKNKHLSGKNKKETTEKTTDTRRQEQKKGKILRLLRRASMDKSNLD